MSFDKQIPPQTGYQGDKGTGYGNGPSGSPATVTRASIIFMQPTSNADGWMAGWTTGWVSKWSTPMVKRSRAQVRSQPKVRLASRQAFLQNEAPQMVREKAPRDVAPSRAALKVAFITVRKVLQEVSSHSVQLFLCYVKRYAGRERVIPSTQKPRVVRLVFSHFTPGASSFQRNCQIDGLKEQHGKEFVP